MELSSENDTVFWMRLVINYVLIYIRLGTQGKIFLRTT